MALELGRAGDMVPSGEVHASDFSQVKSPMIKVATCGSGWMKHVGRGRGKTGQLIGILHTFQVGSEAAASPTTHDLVTEFSQAFFASAATCIMQLLNLTKCLPSGGRMALVKANTCRGSHCADRSAELQFPIKV
jgi:hypothetical protein